MDDQVKRMTEDVQHRIRDLAYLMWESAGRQQGMAMHYWLEAEREILTTMQIAAETMMPTSRQPQPKAAAKDVAKDAGTIQGKPAAQPAGQPQEGKLQKPETAPTAEAASPAPAKAAESETAAKPKARTAAKKTTTTRKKATK